MADFFREEFDAPIGQGRPVTESSPGPLNITNSFGPEYELTAGGELTGEPDYAPVEVTINTEYDGTNTVIHGCTDLRIGLRYDTASADAGEPTGYQMRAYFWDSLTPYNLGVPFINEVDVFVWGRTGSSYDQTVPNTTIRLDVFGYAANGDWLGEYDEVTVPSDLFSPGTAQIRVDLQGSTPKLYVGDLLVVELSAFNLDGVKPLDMNCLASRVDKDYYVDYFRVNVADSPAPAKTPAFWTAFTKSREILDGLR